MDIKEAFYNKIKNINNKEVADKLTEFFDTHFSNDLNLKRMLDIAKNWEIDECDFQQGPLSVLEDVEDLIRGHTKLVYAISSLTCYFSSYIDETASVKVIVYLAEKAFALEFNIYQNHTCVFYTTVDSYKDDSNAYKAMYKKFNDWMETD